MSKGRKAQGRRDDEADAGWKFQGVHRGERVTQAARRVNGFVRGTVREAPGGDTIRERQP
jgi:hypothetical protein